MQIRNELQILDNAGLLEFPQVEDANGCLCFVEARRHVPFGIERVYYINDVPSGACRGSHAHKTLYQVLVCLSGSLTVDLDDGMCTQSYTLIRANQGLYLPPGYWRTMRDFTSGAICLALASAAYDPDDYLHDYDAFIEWRQGQA